MTQTLQDFNVAILVMDGFEEVELTDPRGLTSRVVYSIEQLAPAWD